jgi:hypothetical protein
MSRLVPMGTKLVAALVAAGVLSLSATGAASASTPLLTSAPKVGAHFKCARATKVLARVERTESQISNGLPALTKLQATAKAHGKTRRADRLQRMISRLESPQLKQKLAKAAQTIEARCHVSAPSTSTTSS